MPLRRASRPAPCCSALHVDVLDERHRTPQRRRRHGEPRTTHPFDALHAHRRALTVATARATTGCRPTNHPRAAPCRPPASQSSASNHSLVLPAKATRRRRAAPRRKFAVGGLKRGHFSRPRGRLRVQHGALEPRCPEEAFAPGFGRRAAFLRSRRRILMIRRLTARIDSNERPVWGNLGEAFGRATAARSAPHAKELDELSTFGRLHAGHGRLMHEIEPHYTPVDALNMAKVSIVPRIVDPGRAGSCSGKSAQA